MTPANEHDQKGARGLLAGLKPLHPRLAAIYADAAYDGDPLAAWCRVNGGYKLRVVRRLEGQRGFAVQPKRWIVERTFAWLDQWRRLSKDYEEKVQTTECMIEVAMVGLMLRRLAPP